MSLSESHQNLVRLCRTGAFDAAVELAEDLTQAHPDEPVLWFLLGCARAELGLFPQAESALRKTLTLAPQDPGALYNCGYVLQRQNKLDEAVAHFKASLRLNPRYKEAWNNLGNALRALGQVDAARDALQTALKIDPSFVDARMNLAAVYERGGALGHAIGECDTILAQIPGHKEAKTLLLRLKQVVCDFAGAGALARDVSTLGLDDVPLSPFLSLAFEDHPGRQRQRSEAWVRATYGHIKGEARPAVARRRLKVGYVSANFHEHPGMVLSAGLLRGHERSLFELVAVSTRQGPEDAWTAFVKEQCSDFLACGGLSDAEIVARVRALDLDVAIDLDGHTRGARLEMFAHRISPLQLSFLGFPGTSGAAFFDYLVADQHVIPPAARGHYTEAVIYLPGSYQCNDDQRAIAAIDDTRADHGLPAQGVVLCCFNASYKIGAAEFSIWMEVLRSVPDAVLWLYRSNDEMVQHLQRAAMDQGVAAGRLIFAERLPHAAHLGRLRHADLCVDTFHCNAHTTASDALWAGVPVITLAGQQFAARVGASLLHASSLDDLVTHKAEDYRARLLSYAASPERCAALKARVAKARRASALFDTAGYVRGFEAGLHAAQRRALEGLPPQDITVPPV